MTQSEQNRSLWETALEHTRGRSPATFDRWFSSIQFDGFTDGILALRAKDIFVRDWVCEHYLPTISERLREQTELSIQVVWTIGEIASPVAVVASADGPVSSGRSVVRPSPLRPSVQPAVVAPPPARAVVTPAVEVVAPAPEAAPRPEGLDRKYTFENFVVGPSNELAHAAAMAASFGGGRRYSPLFLCGGTGLGKTHLMQAIAHKVLAERPEKRIVYVSAERFTNDFIASIQNKRMDEFRRRHRVECDLLLVDDVQFLAGRVQTQEEFFHTFNALYALDRPIVLSSDKYPQHLEHMEERLVSRFTWGLVADVQVPELETRVAIVRKKAEIEGVEMADDVAIFLAQTVRSNVRELEGALVRLAAKSSLTGQPVDLDFAKAEMQAVHAGRPQGTSIDDIQRAVCHHFHLRSGELLSKDRHKSTALARHVAMYLCKQRLKVSFPELGRAFGKDHTTVMSAVRKVHSLRETDPEVRGHLEAIERRLVGSE